VITLSTASGTGAVRLQVRERVAASMRRCLGGTAVPDPALQITQVHQLAREVAGCMVTRATAQADGQRRTRGRSSHQKTRCKAAEYWGESFLQVRQFLLAAEPCSSSDWAPMPRAKRAGMAAAPVLLVPYADGLQRKVSVASAVANASDDAACATPQLAHVVKVG
jgi:hypothetical protein